MFSRFFEKNKSNGQILDYFKARKKEGAFSNVSCNSIGRYLTSASNSPQPNKGKSKERRTAPHSSGKIVVASKSTSKPVKRINRVNSTSKEKEKPRSSRSPKTLQNDFYDYFSSKGLKKVPKKSIGYSERSALHLHRLSANKTEESLRPESANKKMLTALQKAYTPKIKTPPIKKTVLSKKSSRETSQKTRKLSERNGSKPKRLSSRSPHQPRDFSKTIDNEKKRTSSNGLFLSCAQKNEAEKCLQLLSLPVQEHFGPGAQINCQDKNGWTALHHACWNENLKFVNILLYNDAEVNIKDSGGMTPIYLSVSKGNAQITKVTFS